jgi:mannose-6-phosphate isomerase
MNTLYPLKFSPIFKQKIWGGNQIKTLMGIDHGDLPNCGEMWVLSGVEDEESIVSNGFLKGNTLNELVEIYMADLVGEKVFDTYGVIFPILLKFIDTNDYLSVQVHPDDKLAMERHGEAFGKTEMWYVLSAKEDSELISGFTNDVSKETYLQNLENKTLKGILNTVNVSSGDVYFIPAGRVHAIGSGILLAEIQQTSDITYRIYDWDRIDTSGLPRELHTDLALDAIDFKATPEPRTRFQPRPNLPVTLVTCPQFTTKFIECTSKTELDYSDKESFVILLCTEGSFTVTCTGSKVPVKKGEVVLLPAEINLFELLPEPKADILEIFI